MHALLGGPWLFKPPWKATTCLEQLDPPIEAFVHGQPHTETALQISTTCTGRPALAVDFFIHHRLGHRACMTTSVFCTGHSPDQSFSGKPRCAQAEEKKLASVLSLFVHGLWLLRWCVLIPVNPPPPHTHTHPSMACVTLVSLNYGACE